MQPGQSGPQVLHEDRSCVRIRFVTENATRQRLPFDPFHDEKPRAE